LAPLLLLPLLLLLVAQVQLSRLAGWCQGVVGQLPGSLLVLLCCCWGRW
jgi:hypothetical protein